MSKRWGLTVAWSLLAGCALAATDATGAKAAAEVSVEPVIVTARLREEDAQDVPGALSVVGEELLKVTRTDNVAQVTQLAPSVN